MRVASCDDEPPVRVASCAGAQVVATLQRWSRLVAALSSSSSTAAAIAAKVASIPATRRHVRVTRFSGYCDSLKEAPGKDDDAEECKSSEEVECDESDSDKA